VCDESLLALRAHTTTCNEGLVPRLLWVGTHCTLSIPTSHTHHIRQLTAQGKLGIFHTVLPQCRNKSSTLQSARGQRGRTRSRSQLLTRGRAGRVQSWAQVKTWNKKAIAKLATLTSQSQAAMSVAEGGGLVQRAQVGPTSPFHPHTHAHCLISAIAACTTDMKQPCPQAQLAARALLAHHARKVRVLSRAVSPTASPTSCT
jgi:hypothetical protein